jgi:acylphosphatase
MIKHVSIIVIGKVQGVFFRASTAEKAEALGVTGYVRNEPDGNVFIEAEAEEAVLEKFVGWCKQGPPRAQVLELKINTGELKGFKQFEIRR